MADRSGYQTAYWQNNQDKLREYRRQHYLANRDKRLEQMWVTNLRRRYGITPEQYEAMLVGGCHVCGATEGYKGKRLAVDHCHDTGKVRGLLCDRCNLVIGKVDAATLRAAADYLDNT